MAQARRLTKRRTNKTSPKTVTGSVVPAKYRERYQDGSCGDEIALQLKKRCTAADGTFDLAKLKAIAVANDVVWNERWDQINPGLARLSCGNRLRALARRQSIKWRRP